MSAWRRVCVALLAVWLAGCAGGGTTPTPGAAHGCDRNGDEDQRRAC